MQQRIRRPNLQSSAGLQSFPVLTPNGPRIPPSEIRAVVYRYWFIVTLALLATAGIVAAIVAVVLKAKRPEALDGYATAQPGLASGSIIVVSLEHLVKPMYETDFACRTTLMT